MGRPNARATYQGAGAEDHAASAGRALAIALVIAGAATLGVLPAVSAVGAIPLDVVRVAGAVAGLVAMVGGIKLLAAAWAATTKGVWSREPQPEPVDLATPEQLAAVVEAVKHAPEPVQAPPKSAADDPRLVSQG